MLCEDLEGKDGGRREAHEGGDVCKITADSCCCMAETSTTL